MDLLVSPIATVILNLIASLLVSKGILDSHSTVAFVQMGNNFIAATGTAFAGAYGLYKLIDFKKHQLTMTHSVKTTSTVTNPTSPVAGAGQSGLPQSTQKLPPVTTS